MATHTLGKRSTSLAQSYTPSSFYFPFSNSHTKPLRLSLTLCSPDRLEFVVILLPQPSEGLGFQVNTPDLAVDEPVAVTRASTLGLHCRFTCILPSPGTPLCGQTTANADDVDNQVVGWVWPHHGCFPVTCGSTQGAEETAFTPRASTGHVSFWERRFEQKQVLA